MPHDIIIYNTHTTCFICVYCTSIHHIDTAWYVQYQHTPWWLTMTQNIIMIIYHTSTTYFIDVYSSSINHAGALCITLTQHSFNDVCNISTSHRGTLCFTRVHSSANATLVKHDSLEYTALARAVITHSCSPMHTASAYVTLTQHAPLMYTASVCTIVTH